MKSAAFSSEWLASRLATLLPEFPDISLCVALSGGLDSVTLLAALAGTRPRRSRKPRLRAVHVHHGLHANADKWSEHCVKLASNLHVPLANVRVRVARPRGASLEAAAREARYQAFERELAPGEVLLTAHHEDDQLETVLLQLLRGAGVAGLAAMPEKAPFAQGWLVRPMLSRSRAELERWAREHRLSWVDDDTNADESLDRNYLRRRVLPVLRDRWPGAASSVSRSARHAAEARRLLDALALADVERAAVGPSLSVQRLRVLDDDRRRNALRFWIARAGHPLPDTRRLDELAGALLQARPDANPHVQWQGLRVERHANLLSIRTESEAARIGDIPWNWRDAPRIPLAGSGAELSLEADPHGPVDIDKLPETLTIRARQGGERLRPRQGGPTRTLKALLQEARIAPGERARLPLLFAGDALVAVGDRWLDSSLRATSQSAHRARLRLLRRA